MPNIKSAKKRVNVTRRQTEENKGLKTSVKTAVKRVKNSTTDDVNANFSLASKKIDKAVKNGLISKNAAARKKSNLSKGTK